MQTCSSLRIDIQNLALSSDSDDVRRLAGVAAVLCAKIEQLERELRDVCAAAQATRPDASAHSFREKPR